ncbi:HicB [Mycobacterium sp. SWH-M5]|nr:HicB [Mycobacterium sp. SWH-M5]
MNYAVFDVGGRADDHGMTDMEPQWTYRAQWSPEYREYFGLCLEFPALCARAFTAHEAVERAQRLVEQEVADRLAADMDLPQPLTDRRYSGSFMVRTSPALHAKLMVEAAEQRVSLNQWVVQKLAGRPAMSFDDF